jgi:hypothetical protein
MLHLKLRQGQSQMKNVRKSLGFGKGQKAKSAASKGPTTKSTPNQPNAMEAWFARLEVLVTNMASNMVTLVKPTTLALNYFSTQGFDLGLFCGAGFSRPLSPNEIELGISNDYVLRATNDKTMVRVLTITLITRASA